MISAAPPAASSPDGSAISETNDGNVICDTKTPDGRYFVSEQKLWRCESPYLKNEDHAVLSAQLAATRTALKARVGVDKALARRRIHSLRLALGEIGPVWWNDGAPDYSRSLVRVTPYAGWYTDLIRSRHSAASKIRKTTQLVFLAADPADG